MLVAMAGLPGTGKSTVARALRADLAAEGRDVIVLDKDEIRAALFPPEAIEYSAEQDDLCMEIVLLVAGFLLQQDRDRVVILDGRTFTRRYHVERVVQAADPGTSTALIFIECRCADDTALRRLAQDRVRASHPAANRDATLYHWLKTHADPLELPHLVVDTDEPLADVVRRCRAYLAETIVSLT